MGALQSSRRHVGRGRGAWQGPGAPSEPALPHTSPQDMGDKEGGAGVELWPRCRALSVNRGAYRVPLGVLVWMGFLGCQDPRPSPSPHFRQDPVASADCLRHPPVVTWEPAHSWSSGTALPQAGAGHDDLQGQPWGDAGRSPSHSGGSLCSSPESLGTFCLRSLWAAKLGFGL